MKQHQAIAIIPARGGSKRLPDKNILDFFGKPMIAWTIEAAIKSNMFARIFVSTDSPTIAKIAEDYGIAVPFLRSDCSDDYTPVSDATLLALTQIKHHFQEEYEIVAQLMPNCPLRNSQDLINAYQFFLQSTASAQISSFKYGWMNPWWAATLDHANVPQPLFPEQLKKRSQDLPALYCPSGAIWLGKVADVMREKTFYCHHHIFYPMPWQSAVDIDDSDDLAFAKAVFLMTQQHEKMGETHEVDISN